MHPSVNTVTLALSGASGMAYGLRLLECLLAADVRVHLLVSQAAHVVAKQELGVALPARASDLQKQLGESLNARDGQLRVFGRDDWNAPVACGSARICEAGHAARLVQVGIRTLNRHCREQAARFGVEIVPMAGFTPGRVPVLGGPLYISIDLDGIDPSAAPGVAHPEPGGLTVRELLAVLHKQTAPIVGADIVELHPGRDVGGVTAILAAKLVRELAALIDRNGNQPTI